MVSMVLVYLLAFYRARLSSLVAIHRLDHTIYEFSGNLWCAMVYTQIS